MTLKLPLIAKAFFASSGMGVGKRLVAFAIQVGNAGTGHDQGRQQHTYNDDRGQKSGFDMQLKCLHASSLIISILRPSRQPGLLAKVVARFYSLSRT